MAEGAYLDDVDLRRITGYARMAEQRRFLQENGIPFKPVGSRTIVMHRHVEAWIQGRHVPRMAEPNLALVR